MEKIKYYKEFIKDNKVNSIDEGAKEWILSGLLTLSSLAGISQMKQSQEFSAENIKAAEVIQNKLESGDKDVINLLDDSDIDLNAENLKKLKEVDIDKSKINIFKTGNERLLKSKLKQGWTLVEIGLKKDTKLPKDTIAIVKDIIELDYSSDALFKTASYELTDEYIDDLKQVIDEIMNIGEITDILIESSTDKEPISIGNDKLSKLRANSVNSVLTNIGLGNIKIETFPDQGPDIYNKGMSRQERINAREKTSKYRYVKIIIEFEREIEIEEMLTYPEIEQVVNYKLIRPIEDNTIGTYKFKGKNIKRKKHSIDKLKVKDIKTECPKW